MTRSRSPPISRRRSGSPAAISSQPAITPLTERHLHGLELRRDTAQDPRRRHGGRRDESSANRAAAPVGSRHRRGQPASLGTNAKLKVRFSVINLTNEDALYNFLSTFSGTHFVTPRAYQVQAGVTF